MTKIHLCTYNLFEDIRDFELSSGFNCSFYLISRFSELSSWLYDHFSKTWLRLSMKLTELSCTNCKQFLMLNLVQFPILTDFSILRSNFMPIIKTTILIACSGFIRIIIFILKFTDLRYQIGFKISDLKKAYLYYYSLSFLYFGNLICKIQMFRCWIRMKNVIGYQELTK